MNLAERNIEVSLNSFSFSSQGTEIIEATTEKISKNKKPSPNYLKQLYRCGIRTNDNVLVIGAGNIEMLKKMAKLVGCRGKITILDNDPVALAKVRAAAVDGQFAAFKQFSGGHPAFDMRPLSKRYVPIAVKIESLTFDGLAFEDNQFSATWIEQYPRDLTTKEAVLLASELHRVTEGPIIQIGV